MLVNLAEMLQDAKKHNYAIAPINTPNQISLRAVIAAAEERTFPSPSTMPRTRMSTFQRKSPSP